MWALNQLNQADWTSVWVHVAEGPFISYRFGLVTVIEDPHLINDAHHARVCTLNTYYHYEAANESPVEISDKLLHFL